MFHNSPFLFPDVSVIIQDGDASIHISNDIYNYYEDHKSEEEQIACASKSLHPKIMGHQRTR